MAGRLAGASATAFPKFCLQDPSELWVAEDGHTIVGFGFSWMTEKFWYLSQLFVRCETQAKGIGRALLSKTLMKTERYSAADRALITFVAQLLHPIALFEKQAAYWLGDYSPQLRSAVGKGERLPLFFHRRYAPFIRARFPSVPIAVSSRALRRFDSADR